MPQITPFSAQASAISASVTASASASTPLPAKGNTLRVVNEGPNVAFLSIGAGAQTATVPSGSAAQTCMAVLASSDSTFTIPNDAVYNFSAICRAAQTAVLTIYVGEGQ